ncbi:MAG TPA: sialate O-acetylesterase [Bryobacteraceae bacterium]|nr:sialate O-acetylesterase [Bryobacteraceae bacterium]
MNSRIALLPAVLFTAAAVHAEVSLPHILTEHMVIQRDLPVHIWGSASPDETVSVTFRGAIQAAKADALGRWSVYLPPGGAGGPFDLTVKGTNTIAFHDILIGDVWVASGQSNMEFKLRQAENAQTEIADAKYPKIRRALVDRKTADYPLEDTSMQPWTDINPENAGGASAVAYFFARDLQEKLNGVPIGIIETFWGGTPVEAWTSMRALGSDPALSPFFSEWGRFLENWPTAQATYDKRLADWTAAGSKPPKPGLTESRPGGANGPTALYNGMIAPVIRYPIKGVIWYQGESNANAGPAGASLYARAFQTMIRDWRKVWGEGDFPFLYVQLANYKASPAWAELREAQRQTLSLANTGMATIIDIGNPTNIHPTDKQDVGHRLALAARVIAYGEKIEDSGPMFREARPEGATMRVWFEHTTGGMNARGGGALKGFEIAGGDRKYIAADAKIEGNSIVVSSPAVAAPMYVRYAWADNPDCNLYNGENLPASPFGSE